MNFHCPDIQLPMSSGRSSKLKWVAELSGLTVLSYQIWLSRFLTISKFWVRLLNRWQHDRSHIYRYVLRVRNVPRLRFDTSCNASYIMHAARARTNFNARFALFTFLFSVLARYKITYPSRTRFKNYVLFNSNLSFSNTRGKNMYDQKKKKKIKKKKYVV